MNLCAGPKQLVHLRKPLINIQNKHIINTLLQNPVNKLYPLLGPDIFHILCYCHRQYIIKLFPMPYHRSEQQT